MFNNIKHYRSRAGLTQRQVAEKLNISQQVFSNWENNQVYIRTGNKYAIAEILDATFDQLFNNAIPQAPQYPPSEP